MNVIKDPQISPLTGTSHILLQYQPYIEDIDKVDFIHMGGNTNKENQEKNI